MKIPVYASLQEKSSFFEHQVIDDKVALDSLIATWGKKDDKKGYIFRGANEASFKLFNSGQRAWLIQELDKYKKSYKDFIVDEINYAKAFQNNLLIKFYKAFGHQAYDFSILSFLQHYGAPTPLLDFTYNFDCAIFFGLDYLKHSPGDDINNYFSIYAIDTNARDFISILQHLESSVGQIEDILERNQNLNIDANDALNGIAALQYQTFSELTLFYLPGYTPSGTAFSIAGQPGFNLVYNQHNLNIINQEGLFVFNNDPAHPLEDYFTGLDSLFNEDDKRFNKTFVLPKIKCWDIHKSFDVYLTEHLNSKLIDKAFIYPQEEFIALNAFKDFKKL